VWRGAKGGRNRIARREDSRRRRSQGRHATALDTCDRSSETSMGACVCGHREDTKGCSDVVNNAYFVEK